MADTDVSATPVLYNADTRQPDPIDDPQALHQALLTGTHSFPQGTKVNAVDPDGQLVSVDATKVPDAIRAGYSINTPSQQSVEDYVKANQGIKGTLKVGLGQFANQAALGIPELIYDKLADPLDVAKKNALKKEDDFANSVGGVGGFGASLLTGGPLWEGAAKVGSAATEAVAARLALRTGEEVGSRSIKSVAKDIVSNIIAKGAGGAAEGAVIAAPHAITETALGDPGDAAESLVAGIGVGSLLGGGGALAKDLFKVGAQIPEMIGGQAENAQTMARKLGHFATGVPEEHIERLAANPERVAQAPEVESIKDAIDSIHSQHSDQVDLGEQNLANATNELSEAYRGAKFDLARTKAPAELADDITGALENQKSVLGSLSEQADDALARTPGTIEKQHLTDFVDKLGKSIGVGEKGALIGDEATNAVKKLFEYRQRMEALPDELTFPEVRDVMRQVRKDINFNQGAGEFNDTKNLLLRKFTGGISDVLKERSPEYAQYMSRMADLSDNLAEMSQHFGDRQKALGALNNIFKQSGSGIVKNEALTRFGQLNGEDWMGKLAEFKKAGELLEEAKRGDISQKLLPELSQKLQDAKDALTKAQETFAPIKRLDQNRTQSIIRNQGFKNASIEDRKALEAMSQMPNGQDFINQIKDRNALDAFNKQYIQGSRKAVLGFGIGNAVAGPIGGAIGAGAGGLMDAYGGQLLKKFIESNKSKAGLLFVEQAYKKVAEQLDEVPKVLDRMSMGSKATGTGTGTTAVMRIMQTHKGQEFDEHQHVPTAERIKALEHLNEKASTLVGNPGGMMNQLSAMSAPLTNGGAPQIGQAFNEKMVGAMNYLYTSMPKPPRPSSPFAPKAVWRPSDQELAAYEQKIQVIHNPFSVLKDLEHGTLTRNHMQALRTVYPGIHAMIQRKVQDHIIRGDAKPMAYGQRLKLSLLMDAPMDSSMTPQSIQYYQGVAAGQQSEQDAQGQGGNAQGGAPFKADVTKLANNLGTDTDRRGSRLKT